MKAARKEHASALRRSREARFDAEYVAGDLGSLASDPERAGPYDVVFCCNVYHLLGPIGRREFTAALAAAARPGGLLFLSALSPRDLEHYAVGQPVSGEERSWVDKVYLHFCTAEELTRDFAAFEVLDLEERSYDEPLESGPAAPPHELVPGGAPALSLRLAGAERPGPPPASAASTIRASPDSGSDDLVHRPSERDEVQLAARVLAERRDLRDTAVRAGQGEAPCRRGPLDPHVP